MRPTTVTINIKRLENMIIFLTFRRRFSFFVIPTNQSQICLNEIIYVLYIYNADIVIFFLHFKNTITIIIRKNLLKVEMEHKEQKQ